MKNQKFRKVLGGIAALLVLTYVALVLNHKGHEFPMQLQQDNTKPNLTVAIFGATGTIGDGILKASLDDPRIKKIHVITRRPSARIEEGVQAGKVEMTIHKDYLDYAEIAELFADIDAVYWAIGLSAVGLDEEAYREIHLDYPAKFVEAWLRVRENEHATFHYVSGSGAKADSRMMWAKEKAKAEQALATLAEGNGIRVFSYRPALILPTDTEAHLGHKIMHSIFSPIGGSVAAETIGAGMIEASAGGAEAPSGTVFENKDIILLGETTRQRR